MAFSVVGRTLKDAQIFDHLWSHRLFMQTENFLFGNKFAKFQNANAALLTVGSKCRCRGRYPPLLASDTVRWRRWCSGFSYSTTGLRLCARPVPYGARSTHSPVTDINKEFISVVFPESCGPMTSTFSGSMNKFSFQTILIQSNRFVCIVVQWQAIRLIWINRDHLVKFAQASKLKVKLFLLPWAYLSVYLKYTVAPFECRCCLSIVLQGELVGFLFVQWAQKHILEQLECVWSMKSCISVLDVSLGFL